MNGKWIYTIMLTVVISRWSHYEELSLSKSFMSVLSEYLIKWMYYLYNHVVRKRALETEIWSQISALLTTTSVIT